MSWRTAHSLTVLRKSLNKRFPNRSKISDGLLGDRRHRSTKSDHNPNRNGIVRAFDVTHDPANGVDCNKLASALINSRDPRIKYLIWNRRILSSTKSPWKWRKYTGKNGHTKHLHISVNDSNCDDSSPWNLDFTGSIPLHPDPELIEFGDMGFAVDRLQRDLIKLGYLAEDQDDGQFGNITLKAVKAFQARYGLDADGMVGPNTFAAIKVAIAEYTPKPPIKIEIEEPSLEVDAPSETSDTPTANPEVTNDNDNSASTSNPLSILDSAGDQVEKASQAFTKAQPILDKVGKMSKSSAVKSAVSGAGSWGTVAYGLWQEHWEIVAIGALLALGWYIWTNRSKERVNERLEIVHGTGDGR